MLWLNLKHWKRHAHNQQTSAEVVKCEAHNDFPKLNKLTNQ